MKRMKWMFAAAALATLASGCFIDIDDDNDIFGCVRGRGPIVSQEFILPTIYGLAVSLPADVFIKNGPTQEIIVEGEENILDEISFEVRNGIWQVNTDRCVKDVDDLRIFVTLPEVEELSIIGSGNMTSENVLAANNLELNVVGSGNIDIAVEANDIDAGISGSGDIRLEGLANKVILNISGSGNYRAFGLDALTTDIRISGSGDAWVFVQEALKVRISGSGDVRYRGNPSLDIAISGSGRVIDDN